MHINTTEEAPIKGFPEVYCRRGVIASELSGYTYTL